MTIILVGLNHRTAPVQIRERLALPATALSAALDVLRGSSAPVSGDGNGAATVHEGLILSTCNRLEVYAVVDNAETGRQHLSTFLAELQDASPDDLKSYLYYSRGTDVVGHLMRVACGLDSMILGEPQILGQVAQAYDSARASGATGPILSQLFSQAIHAGKRARAESDISRFTTSVGHAGVSMLLEKASVAAPNVLVSGAGEMAVLAARELRRRHITNLTFINRTYSRAEALASEFDGNVVSWLALNEALVWADAVITATGAPHPVIYARDLHDLPHRRQHRPLVLIDIAMPRDVEVAVGEVDGVQRYDLDDLQSIVDVNTAQRQLAVPLVESIIDQERGIFLKWLHSREITPLIHDLRRRAAEVAQVEVGQALNKLGDVDDHTTQVVNRLAHRLVNKLLHEPTVRLRDQAALGNGHVYAHAVSELFGLQTAKWSPTRDPLESRDTP